MSDADRTRRPIVLVLGPTAGGKTTLAIELARRLPGGGECLCADSMQVYRDMDIGTAKPSPAERAIVPHHGFDVADPAESDFSVDTWLDSTVCLIEAIRTRGAWPIVVGGTNLYIQALVAGLFDGPAPDPRLRRELEPLTGDELRARLEAVDPAAAERIHPNDRKRTIRAIEVHAATGMQISELQRQWSSGSLREDLFVVGLDYPADVINRRINARVREMMAAGLLDEVRSLWLSNRLGRQAREALGYKQLIDHLEGRSTLEEAVEQIKIRTRRFAKQQRTWLRRFHAIRPAVWIAPDERGIEGAVEAALVALVTDAGEDR